MTKAKRREDTTPVPRPRGACPRLSAPMETGDGLLARLVPSGPIAIDAFASLCAAARTHGNGLMEITARGSLQVRGLSDVSAPRFAASVEALGVPFDDRLPVIVPPLPDHPGTRLQARVLATALRQAVADRDLQLAPKVSVVIDDGGPISLDRLSADVRLRALEENPSSRLLVSVGGDLETATPLGVTRTEDAAALVTDLLAVLAESGERARARDVISEEGTGRFVDAAGDRLAASPENPPLRNTETIGLHRLHHEMCAIGVALPFGQADALDLIALTRIAGANGAAWTALAPQRTLLLGPIGEMTAFALGTAADTLGFVVDSRDARRRIAACAGAPACAAGYIPSRDLAARIAACAGAPACAAGYIPSRNLAARIAEELPQGPFALHISGCSKGCAHPRPAPLTMMGTGHGALLVDGDTVLHRPSNTLHTDDLIRDIVRRVAAESTDA